MRKEFYDGSSWEYEKCEKHTIFISQASYPIKGLHQLLKATPLILRDFPDTKILIAGHDITKVSTFVDRIKLTGYGKIIRKMIKKYHLEKHVDFLGPLNAEEMKKTYLKCNVFICPSSIENSPNSLGEAQILGVPCIASYVGGIPDMMKGCEENMYRFEEVEMLAEKVCIVFRNKAKQINMQCKAKNRHDKLINGKALYDIYKSIISL